MTAVRRTAAPRTAAGRRPARRSPARHTGVRHTAVRHAAVRRTAALLALLLVAALAVPVTAQGAAHASASPAAQPGATSRVLLQLDTAFTPPGLLTAAARTAQSQRLAAVRGQALSRVASTGARALRTYDRLPYVAVEASTPELRALRSAPEVAAVLPDEVLHASLASSAPHVGAPPTWSAGHTGTGHTVAVIDSGVERNHAFLAGKVVDEACFSAGGGCPNGQDTQYGTGAAAPCTFDTTTCPHGTHVAGIVAGSGKDGSGNDVAGIGRGASIAAVQIFSRSTDCPGGATLCAVGRTSDLLAGLDHVAALAGTRPVAAVNLSLGGGSYSGSCDSQQSALKTAVDTLRSLGVATVVASGNAGSATTMSAPACLSTAVAVGSASLQDVVSSFSNSSSELDLLAPGEQILSSYSGVDRAAHMSGTSQAAPHVAGALAVLRDARPASSVAQLVQALTASGTTVVDERNGRTTPRLRVDAAVTALASIMALDTTSDPAPAPAPAPVDDAEPLPDAQPVQDSEPVLQPSGDRLAGTDRYATASRVFDAAFGCALGGTGSAVLARGDAFADALAGSYLAGTKGTGVLLTATTSVPAATLGSLRASGARTVYLLGGTSAISDAVARELTGTASVGCDGTPGPLLEVVRIAGLNRFDTARASAQQPGAAAVGTADLGSGSALRTAVVASGLGFADALAAGPLSYGGAADGAQGSGGGFPTLLTAPDALSPEAEAALTALDVEQVVVPGGTAVVSAAVVSRLEGLGIRVVRVAGRDRMETAAAVAQLALDRLGFSQSAVTLARGDAFADALAGAAYAGDRAVPLLLAAGPTVLGDPTHAHLAAQAGVTSRVTAFGGTGAISAATLDEAVQALS